MARRVVLHIGTMKSGTTFIQSVLKQNRDRLREQGILFPGARWRDQVAAVRDLAYLGRLAASGVPEGSWDRLVEEIRAWPGVAVVSMEFLGPRNRGKIEKVRDSFADSELDVVLTARDLARNLPAMWIESTQNRGTTNWDEYCRLVKAGDATRADPRRTLVELSRANPGRAFWRQQDVPAMTRRWTKVVGKDRFTIVTVPRPGAPRDQLWERFSAVAGLPGDCNLAVRGNPSLGAAAAELLRRLNIRLRDTDLTEAEYSRLVKHQLAKQALAGRPGSGDALAVSEPWVMKRSRADIDQLRTLGVRVVGDLDELVARPVKGLRGVDLEAQLDAAVDSMTALLLREAERRRRRGAEPARGAAR